MLLDTRRARKPFSGSSWPIGQVRLVAETSGPASAASATDPERPRYG